MTRYRGIQLLLLLSLTCMLTACLNLKQPRTKIEFYALEYTPALQRELPTLASVIRIDHFSVAPPYNSNQIIYRDKSFKRGAYFYHKWRSNPGDFITYFLGRDMKQSGLFKAVLPHDSRFLSSHRLEGTVDEFLEWEADDSREAILSISVVLISRIEQDVNKKILFQKTYRAKKSCQQKHPRALAEAMSGAMSEVSEEITRDVYGYLKDSEK